MTPIIQSIIKSKILPMNVMLKPKRESKSLIMVLPLLSFLIFGIMMMDSLKVLMILSEDVLFIYQNMQLKINTCKNQASQQKQFLMTLKSCIHPIGAKLRKSMMINLVTMLELEYLFRFNLSATMSNFCINQKIFG